MVGLQGADNVFAGHLDEKVELISSDIDRFAAERLQQIAASSHQDGGPRIYLRADRGLDFGRVMELMGEINRAGLRRVALVSTAREER